MSRPWAPAVRGALFAGGYVLLVQNAVVPVAAKLAFLAGCVLMAVVSASRIPLLMRARGLDEPRGFWVPASIIVGLLFVGLSSLIWTPVTTLENWVRDALTYICLPVAILIATEFGLAVPRRINLGLIWAVGAVGAVGFTGTWLQRRGATEFNAESFGLASSFVPIPAIALGLALFFASRRTGLLPLLGSLAIAGVLAVSGGRTIWIYVSAGLIVAIFLGVFLYKKLHRALVLLVGAVGATTLVLTFSEASAGGIAATRVQWFRRLAENGWSVLLADGSAIERTRAYAWSIDLWLANPVWGRGWGQPFPSVSTGVINDGIFTFDSPFVVLVKLGAVGAALLSLALALWVAATLSTAEPRSVARSSLFIAFTMALVLLPNGFPTENRGFPIFLFCLTALSVGSLFEKRAFSRSGISESRKEWAHR